MSRLRRPSRDQLEHLELAGGELRRVLARGGPRAARDVRGAAPAQLARARPRPRRRRRARAARRAPAAGTPRRRRRRARARPRTGSRARSSRRGLVVPAGELERVRLGDVDAGRPARRRRGAASTRARRPPSRRRGAARGRARRRSRRRPGRGRRSATPPRRGRRRPARARWSSRPGQRERLVERRPRIGSPRRARRRPVTVSASITGSGDAVRSRMISAAVLGRVVPAPLVELGAGAVAEQVDPPQVEDRGRSRTRSPRAR